MFVLFKNYWQTANVTSLTRPVNVESQILYMGREHKYMELWNTWSWDGQDPTYRDKDEKTGAWK